MSIHICTKCGKFIKGSKTPYGGKYYHRECMVCAYCGGELHGRIATFNGDLYHPECNPASGKKICAYCRKEINQSHYIVGDKRYHKECYHNHIQKRCVICGQSITGPYVTDYWGNSAHTLHNGEKSQLCFSCGRFVSAHPTYLAPNIALCEICSSTAITTDSQVEECRSKVLQIFQSRNVTGIPEKIPVVLKNKEYLGNATGRIKYSIFNILGASDFVIEMTYGLPELHFQGVLAHEMLHSWLALYARSMSKEENEGFCNLGSAFVYQHFDTPHASYLLKSLYKSTDAVYGDGYRQMKERYEHLGWLGLLESLKRK
ncbi:MAG: protein DA1 [Bacteroidales bacterium]|nr:protein DA1 [Bacteroidales bacterium]